MFTRTGSAGIRPAAWAAVAVVGFGGLFAADAQVVTEPPPIRDDVPRHIRSITPRLGPVGTEVRMWTDGLPPNTLVHIGIGEMQGCGYEVCRTTQTDARGELMATLEIPEWGHWTHFEVVVILDEAFRPIASSDPFHIVNEDGWIQREGVVIASWHGCPALEGADGVTYALVGQHSMSLRASEGHEMIIEGPILEEGACTLQNAIDVRNMELAPPKP